MKKQNDPSDWVIVFVCLIGGFALIYYSFSLFASFEKYETMGESIHIRLIIFGMYKILGKWITSGMFFLVGLYFAIGGIVLIKHELKK